MEIFICTVLKNIKQIFDEAKSDIKNYSVEFVIFDDALAESNIINARLNNSDIRFCRVRISVLSCTASTMRVRGGR